MRLTPTEHTAIVQTVKQFDPDAHIYLFVDFYTCLETGFVRISKFFENNLESARWQSHLLERMTIDVPGVRKRVISDETYSALIELMKFRHFKRYYFEFNFNRDRIDYLEKLFVKALPAVRRELKEYLRFLAEDI